MWPLLLLGGVLFLLSRKSDGEGGTLLDAAQDAGDDLADDYHEVAAEEDLAMGNVPEAAQPYLPIVIRAAQGSDWDPFVLLGIGWRETKWGTSSFLDQTGPTGTGDYVVRPRSWVLAQTPPTPGVQFVGGVYANDLGKKWSNPPSKSNPSGIAPQTPDGQPNLAVPADSRGWGRGLMQLDWGRAQQIAWADPEANIHEAVAVLNEKRRYIAAAFPDLSPDELVRASVAAYNTGQGNVVKLLAGKHRKFPNRSYATDGIAVVDLTTAPGRSGQGDYSADVLGVADSWKGAVS